jgi:hypothetical protein
MIRKTRQFMDLETVLRDNRIRLDEIDFSTIISCNDCDPRIIRGKIGEELVRQWLARCDVEFDEDFPRSSNGYLFEQRDNGIFVLESGITRHGYDFLFRWERKPYIAEVKSLRIRDIADKVDRALSYARQLYQADPTMLVFFPVTCNSQEDIENLTQQHPSVRCIDMGYKLKQLREAIGHYFRNNRPEPGRCVYDTDKKPAQKYANKPITHPRASRNLRP